MSKAPLRSPSGNHVGRLSLPFWQRWESIRGYRKNSPLALRWLFPADVLALSIPGIVFYHTGRHRLNSIFGLTAEGLLTAGLVICVSRLIQALFTNNVKPEQLLLSAAYLWITNILIFALMVLATGRRRALSTG